jgi:hypothetical protein
MNRRSLPSGYFCKQFVPYALLFSVLLLTAHLFGFREHVGIISGTSSPKFEEMFFGAMYLLLYIGSVVLVPILLLASVLDVLFRYLQFSSRRNKDYE